MASLASGLDVCLSVGHGDGGRCSEKELSCFRRAYSCHVAAIDEQAIISLHESGFFRDLSWEPVDHDKQIQKKYTNVYRLPTIKPIDGWFQYDYVLDLAEGTESNYTVIG